MKKVFLILLVCFCTFCTKKKDDTPKGLYSPEQVAVFLKDLYMLEQKVKGLRLTGDSAKIVFAYYEQELYEKHNFNDSTYRESLEYYMDETEKLGKIYGIIADSLSLEERMFTSQEFPEEDY